MESKASPLQGVWGYGQKKGLLCALKNIKLCLLVFTFCLFEVLLFIFAAKQELYGTKRRY
jgi:hypothetical protein